MNKSNSTTDFEELTEREFPDYINLNKHAQNKLVKHHCVVSISDSFAGGFTIYKCKFEAPITINLNHCEKLQIIDSYFEKLNISIIRCPAIKLVNCTIDSLRITRAAGNSEQTTINITHEESTMGDDSSESKIGILEYEGTVQSAITIENSTISKIISNQSPGPLILNLSKSIVDSEDINAIIVAGNCELSITNGSTVKGGIEASKFTATFKVENSTIKKLINFLECQNVVFRITCSVLNDIHVESTSSHLFIIGGSFEKIEIAKSTIHHLTIDKFEKANVTITKFRLSNSIIPRNAIAVIDNSSINNLQLNKFRNESNFKILNTAINNSILIDHSQLGETEFQNVFFDENLQLTLLNSTITESKFYTVSWMKNHELVITEPDKASSVKSRILYFLSLKESYRQLKAVSQEALNKFDALNFQRHEQKIQKEILWLKRDFWDFLLLKTNELFNDYGLSYLRPLGCLFFFHFVWFSIVIFFGDSYHYTFANPLTCFSKVNWSTTVIALSDYLYTIFPLHGTEYLNKEKGWPIIVDILMRISSGYFIYYFLSATRKFHLK